MAIRQRQVLLVLPASVLGHGPSGERQLYESKPFRTTSSHWASGPLVVWLHMAWNRPRQPAPLANGPHVLDFAILPPVALGVVLFVGLLSLSRGGAVAIFTAVGIVIIVSLPTQGDRPVVSSLVWRAVGLLLAIGLSIHGYDQISDPARLRFRPTNRKGDGTIWTAVAKAVPDYLLLGSGVGSPCRRSIRCTWTLADNEGIHSCRKRPASTAADETGVTGLGLMLLAIGLCVSWCFRILVRSARSQAARAAGRCNHRPTESPRSATAR